jgi:hypothetical protein
MSSKETVRIVYRVPWRVEDEQWSVEFYSAPPAGVAEAMARGLSQSGFPAKVQRRSKEWVDA